MSGKVNVIRRLSKTVSNNLSHTDVVVGEAYKIEKELVFFALCSFLKGYQSEINVNAK